MEKKRDLLQKKLDEDLQIDNAIKLQINREFEELKHLEVSLIKSVYFLKQVLTAFFAAKW